MPLREADPLSRWIDITMQLRTGMPHWPGDPDVEIFRYESIELGADYNATRISMSAHTGTHVDSPLHYLAKGAPIEAMPIEAMAGMARVLPLGEIETARIAPGERILLKSSAGALSPAQASSLAARGILLVGIDSLSIGGSGPECGDVHRILLTAGVWIVEGLVLDAVEPGVYEFLCLTLNLIGSDGAPARALLRAK